MLVQWIIDNLGWKLWVYVIANLFSAAYIDKVTIDNLYESYIVSLVESSW